jgi:MerR family transcriptional regulator, copper efflux regulator
MNKALTIGQLSKESGVPAKTIRYYEEVELLPRSARAANGYRVYDARDVDVLRFIKRARDLGFPLEHAAALLALWRDSARASADVRALAEQHVAVVEEKIAELESLKRTLIDLMERCHGDGRPDCPILDDLASARQE